MGWSVLLFCWIYSPDGYMIFSALRAFKVFFFLFNAIRSCPVATYARTYKRSGYEERPPAWLTLFNLRRLRDFKSTKIPRRESKIPKRESCTLLYQVYDSARNTISEITMNRRSHRLSNRYTRYEVSRYPILTPLLLAGREGVLLYCPPSPAPHPHTRKQIEFIRSLNPLHVRLASGS